VRRALVLAAALVAVATAFALRPKPTPGPPLRDFESYYAAGATWRYHGDAYGRDVWRVEKDVPGVVATRDELLPFVGPPFGLPGWDALSRLPFPGAAIVWGTVMALALGTLAFASLRHAGKPLDGLDVAATLALCAGFGPLTSAAALGQVAAVSCAAIVVFPFLLRRRLLVPATLAALVAALQPNLAVVLAARLAGGRAWLAALLAALIAVLGSFLVLSDNLGFGPYLAVVRDHAGAERFIAIQTTCAAVARALGAGPGTAGIVAGAIAAAVVLTLAVQCCSRRYSPKARLALACAAWPLALPFAHEHDFTLAFFPALLAVRTARGAAWVLAALATLAIGVDWLGLAQRPGGAAETTCLALGAALALAVLAREPLAPRHAIPAFAALAVPVVAALAAAHPLPTWPDALSLNFHLPPTLPAAVVWRAEQMRSGIGGLDPVWAALRLFSLAGCALLWAVASRVLRTRATTSERRSEVASTPSRPRAAAYPSA
jgi:hypothetical protein